MPIYNNSIKLLFLWLYIEIRNLVKNKEHIQKSKGHNLRYQVICIAFMYFCYGAA